VTQAALAVDILLDCPLWKAERGIETMLRRAVAAAASMVSTVGGELAIVLTDDAAMRALNREWRGQDQPTNVIAFPAKASPASAPHMLGDIVIAYQTMTREAQSEGKPLMHHLVHLAVHGFLHLAGYDHQTEEETETMEELEVAILARLDIPNPYLRRGVEARI
jgi:probable rRNA maturation factor